MRNSLSDFIHYLPIEDWGFEIFHAEPWRYSPPIISTKTNAPCSEIAAKLEAADQKKKHRRSVDWPSQARYEVLRRANFRCQACGAPASKTELHLDHIKPQSKYPELKYDPDNFQVLCRACNMSKGNKYEDDLRD